MTQIFARASGLSLTEDAGLECIITDIPLLCIGIMAMGMLTFQVVMKRIELLMLLLFASSLFGFIGALLDLGQILVRGHAGIVNGAGLTAVAGYIRSREVFFALSIGVLYLFYWTFVSRQPHGDDTGTDMHCASWARWGYIGITLKWCTLLACMVIFALQVTWRVTPMHHVYGNVYIASATIETTISAIFILKLLLNFYLSPSHLRRRVFLGYVTPIIAFGLSAGLGIGNLVHFSFSETSLGRFLRAVEVYMLVVYCLVILFRTNSTPLATKRLSRAYSIDTMHDKEKGLINDYSAPALPTQIINIRPDPSSSQTAMPQESWKLSRFSRLSKISSWISSDRFSRRYSQREEDRTAPIQEATFAPPDRSLLFQPASPYFATTGDGNADRNRQSMTITEPQRSPSDVNWQEQSAKAFTDAKSFSLTYYDMENESKIPSARRGESDSSTIESLSPVYGLNGIVPPRARSNTNSGFEPNTKSPLGDVTPVTKLMQEKTDIDNTIATLRIQSNNFNDATNSASASEYIVDRALLSVISLETPSTSSSSPNPIGLSLLSAFPEPPAPGTPLNEGVSIHAVPTPRPVLGRTPINRAPVPLDLSSLLGSPSSDLTPSSRFGSAGTQYDVTSFIGDLSDPRSGFVPLSGYFPTSAITAPFTALSDIQSAEESLENTPRARVAELSLSPASVTTMPVITVETPTMKAIARPLGSATMSSSFKAIQVASRSTDKLSQ
ncbi:hypothetical protein FA15DRAFT_751597 [Coprinopsis marcescibilis]|uniref:Uncharacterized protein n=1 Tax=Coprinopsis marcescibilis TaxID=230819 RepID=A0A5C3LBY7_COPMA|nr:hypothetical protein FA15DRAFT_751597 [Coprinopsis marcescibilis]